MWQQRERDLGAGGLDSPRQTGDSSVLGQAKRKENPFMHRMKVGSRRPIRYLTAFFGVAAMASLAAVPLAGISAGSATAAQTARLTGHMVPAVVMGGKPLYAKTTGPDKKGLFSCQAPQSAANPVACYAPAQIRKAYDVPSKLTGAARQSSSSTPSGTRCIVNDLALFDATFGLPTPTVNIICPQPRGCPTFDPTNADQVGWAGEISLDVQWSHAIAPGATIDLVMAKSDADADILAAQQYTINHNLGDVLSQSFGEDETLQANPRIQGDGTRRSRRPDNENMTVFASAGDEGASQPDCNGAGNFFLSA